jgi:hypothetical protein
MVLAVHVEAATAGDAEPAAVRRVDQHRIADRRRGDAVADGVDVAGILVAEDDRRPQAGDLHQALDRVHVGRAHACACDPDDDVAVALRLGLRALDELEGPVVGAQQRGPHARAPATVVRPK